MIRSSIGKLTAQQLIELLKSVFQFQSVCYFLIGCVFHRYQPDRLEGGILTELTTRVIVSFGFSLSET